ncbi:MAG: hypothetical protein QM640_05820 [Niabella sp.]
MAIRKELADKRKAILTPEQNKRFEQNIQEIRKAGKEGRVQTITNNSFSNKKGKDLNGLSRNFPEKASKKRPDDLRLTADQAKKLREWIITGRQKMNDIKGNASLSRQQKQQQLLNLHREQDMSLNDILTPGQKMKWVQKQKELRMMRAQNKEGILTTLPDNY